MLGLEDHRAHGARRIGYHLDVGGGAVQAQAGADQRGVRRVDPHARDFLPLQFFEGAEDQAMQGFGIDGQFAPDDAAGDGQGKLDEVGFRLRAQAGTQAADVFDGARQAVDDGLQFGVGPLPPGGFSLAQTGGVGFAGALFVLLLQLGEALPGIGRRVGVHTEAAWSGGVHLTPNQRLDARCLVGLPHLRRHTAHRPRLSD